MVAFSRRTQWRLRFIAPLRWFEEDLGSSGACCRLGEYRVVDLLGRWLRVFGAMFGSSFALVTEFLR